MMLDFQAWISHLKTESMSIILHNTDNNEEIIRHPGSYHPLHYSNKHVKSSMHDGSLTTLLHTCHLTDALALQHPPPYPRTYIRGEKRLDYIILSDDICPAKTSSGILLYHSLCLGDHRPFFINLDSHLAFGSLSSPISPLI
jgi:hypothetical protein